MGFCSEDNLDSRGARGLEGPGSGGGGVKRHPAAVILRDGLVKRSDRSDRIHPWVYLEQKKRGRARQAAIDHGSLAFLTDAEGWSQRFPSQSEAFRPVKLDLGKLLEMKDEMKTSVRSARLSGSPGRFAHPSCLLRSLFCQSSFSVANSSF